MTPKRADADMTLPAETHPVMGEHNLEADFRWGATTRALGLRAKGAKCYWEAGDRRGTDE